MATVYAVLTRLVEMAKQAHLLFTTVVFDQAIYAKAVDIVLQREVEFRSVVLRTGAFHIASTLPSIIGQRLRDAGLLISSWSHRSEVLLMPVLLRRVGITTAVFAC
eukprot:scpid114324/ scgid35054/ 